LTTILCIFGSHDGWVYAFTTDRGALAWRTRVAPAEQRIVVNGRVESTWPAVGSVLAHEGKLWANAGRGTETDGGIAVVQLDPATGKTLRAGVIGPGPRRRIGLLRVEPAAGKQKAVGPASGILGNPQIRSGGGSMLDAHLGRAGMRGFRAAPSIRAVANGYAVAARTSPEGARVRLVKEGTKEPLATLTLDSAPICDGLAVAAGKVFVALENGKILCLGSHE